MTAEQVEARYAEQAARALQAAKSEFPRRLKRCFYGDKLVHAARNTDLVNIRTACGKWVSDGFIQKQRSEPLTCRACADYTAAEHGEGGAG